MDDLDMLKWVSFVRRADAALDGKLLDVIMPNGKKRGDCTDAELAEMEAWCSKNEAAADRVIALLRMISPKAPNQHSRRSKPLMSESPAAAGDRTAGPNLGERKGENSGTTAGDEAKAT